MPPPGWRKPPGYAGYGRSSTRTRGPANRVRTAGPALTGANADVAINADTAVEDAPEDAEHDHAEGATQNDNDSQPVADLVSSRTRKRRQPAQTEGGEESDDTSGSENLDTDASVHSNDSDEAEAAGLNHNSRTSRARHASCRAGPQRAQGRAEVARRLAPRRWVRHILCH